MKKSLPEWFSYIEGLHAKTIALGLDRIRLVAEKLAVLSFACPVITVGGTNGKGSCVAFLEAILTAAGYRVGAYTSPHLLRFHERIRLATKEVNDEELIHAFQKVELARGEITLTYFEFTTLAALLLFKAMQPDVLILEVGLGGRLDAVNIIDPDVAVITSIALDHMDYLGATRAAIGYEKAGIFRSQRPAICGDPHPPETVLAATEKLQAELYCIGRDFDFTVAGATWKWQSGQICQRDLPIPDLPLTSAATALMALQCLPSHIAVDSAAIIKGLQTAFLPGRFQRFHIPIEIILDVAHNPAAAAYLAEKLSQQPITGSTRAVVGILSDKDILGTLQPLLPLIDQWYVTDLSLPRGTTAESMANNLQKLGVTAYDIHQAESVLAAFEQARNASQMVDRILVFGSFHTVAPVLNYLNNKQTI